MNLSPVLPPGIAIGMALFAASMWGSWAISLKYLNGYPIDAFMMTLLTTSFVFVWTVAILIDRGALFTNLAESLQYDTSRVPVTVLCGIIYVLGMRLSLYVADTIGLTISQPISSSTSIFIGTLISGIIGGVPAGASIIRLAIACVFLFGAVSMGIWAGRMRMEAQLSSGVELGRSGMFSSMDQLWKALGLIVIVAMTIPAYTFGLSFGLKTATHPFGLAVLPFMTMLATGAFLGGLMTCGVMLTIKKQWNLLLTAPFALHKWGIGSGLFHYGGNIIHTFATA